MPQVRIMIVVNNNVQVPNLTIEHGWSVWLDYRGQHALLDTGQGQALAHNARVLSLPWSRVEAVVLSHGHYDHTGGLPVALAAMHKPAIYAHPQAWQPKFSCPPDGPVREIGMRPQVIAQVRALAGRLVETIGPTEVFPGLWLTGSIPRLTEFEDVGGPFFQDPEALRPDLLPDDQAVYFETPQGLVVILGCAHAGVINTLEYIRTLCPGRPMQMVIGGMHLVHASEMRLRQTVAALDRLGVQHLIPAHCTGSAAQTVFSQQRSSWHQTGLAGMTWTCNLSE